MVFDRDCSSLELKCSSYGNPLVLYYICTVRWHHLWHGESLQIR